MIDRQFPRWRAAMTLAGIWLASNEPLALFVDGREPSYGFRFEHFGRVVSQGVVQRLPDGAYLGTGQGVAGPVRFRCWLESNDIMRWQNQAFVDGGVVDGLLGAFMPQLAAAQPVGMLVRQRQATPVIETPNPQADEPTLQDLENLLKEEEKE